MRGLAAVLKVGASAGLDNAVVAGHHKIFCAGELENLCAAGAVIVVRVADEQDLDVTEVEAERLNALADERRRCLEAAVDKD
jgi:hypothetical protein